MVHLLSNFLFEQETSLSSCLRGGQPTGWIEVLICGAGGHKPMNSFRTCVWICGLPVCSHCGVIPAAFQAVPSRGRKEPLVFESLAEVWYERRTRGSSLDNLRPLSSSIFILEGLKLFSQAVQVPDP